MNNLYYSHPMDVLTSYGTENYETLQTSQGTEFPRRYRIAGNF